MINSFYTTFHYNAGYWSNYEEYNLPGGKTGFDIQETKLPTYRYENRTTTSVHCHQQAGSLSVFTDR